MADSRANTILFSVVYSLEVLSSLVLVLSFSTELGLASQIVAVLCRFCVLKLRMVVGVLLLC